jgi:hypothetical protein
LAKSHVNDDMKLGLGGNRKRITLMSEEFVSLSA